MLASSDPFSTAYTGNFFFHALTEHISIAGIPLITSAIAIYIAVRSYPDMRENVYDAT